MKTCDLCQLQIELDEEYTISVKYKAEPIMMRHYHKDCYMTKWLKETPEEKIMSKAIRYKHDEEQE